MALVHSAPGNLSVVSCKVEADDTSLLLRVLNAGKQDPQLKTGPDRTELEKRELFSLFLKYTEEPPRRVC